MISSRFLPIVLISLIHTILVHAWSTGVMSLLICSLSCKLLNNLLRRETSIILYDSNTVIVLN